MGLSIVSLQLSEIEARWVTRLNSGPHWQDSSSNLFHSNEDDYEERYQDEDGDVMLCGGGGRGWRWM